MKFEQKLTFNKQKERGKKTHTTPIMKQKNKFNFNKINYK